MNGLLQHLTLCAWPECRQLVEKVQELRVRQEAVREQKREIRSFLRECGYEGSRMPWVSVLIFWLIL